MDNPVMRRAGPSLDLAGALSLWLEIKPVYERFEQQSFGRVP